MENGERIYALDIGTRTVVGVLLERTAEGLHIIDAELREHKTRAMVDGQIHDVEAVARVIGDVTRTIEERCGYQLQEAAVAAAGRALKTALGRFEIKRDTLAEISTEECLAWELAAVQEGQKQIGENNRPGPALFCVGYSVIHYYLEEQPITSLVGQTGSMAAIEVVATFLPRVVVDSLFASLRRCSLTVKSLTLEPIAALSVAIPENMRLLNLALIDVGAGTSDIALVKRGSTFGYAMVPLGGDEITEAIIENYLVDFDTAEHIKRHLDQEDISFTDILGNSHQPRREEVLECLRPAVQKQAASIAHEILELNSKAPDALIFVGGGSLTPLLLDVVAGEMGMPRVRVGIRERASLNQVFGEHEALQGPQAVTPLGIGYNALTNPGLPFIRIRINGREFPLWNVDGVTVASALLGAGISLNSMYGRPGMGITIEVDGVIRAIRGGRGKAPVILLNNEPAQLDTPVKDQDDITFEPGHIGDDARPRLRELIEVTPTVLWINGEQASIKPVVMLNGQPANLDEVVRDRAQITTSQSITVEDVLLGLGVQEAGRKEEVISYTLNGQPRTLHHGALEIKVNDRAALLNTPVCSGDHIDYHLRNLQPLLQDITLSFAHTILIRLNNEPLNADARVEIFQQDELLPSDTILIDGMNLTSTPPHCMVSDLLNYVQLRPSLSGRLTLIVNGEKAGFTTAVYEGDEVNIGWAN